MSNIYPSISEKLAELNIDIFHYEDIAFASHAIPTLSTISQPKFDMGKIAAEKLLTQIPDKEKAVEHIITARILSGCCVK